jgi:hypothetical protein
MKKYTIILFALLVVTNTSKSQVTIVWQKCLGTTVGDGTTDASITNDGGFILGGSTIRNCPANTNDWFIVKTDSLGNQQWDSQFGGSQSDYLESVIQTSDGGYMLIGYTTSTDGNVVGAHGSYDGWIVKTDATGNFQWQKAVGGTNSDMFRCGKENFNGNIIIFGSTSSYDGDLQGINSSFNTVMWSLEINLQGSIVSQKCFPNTSNLTITDMYVTNEGEYILTGSSTGNFGQNDVAILKADSSLNIQWTKVIGGSGNDVGIKSHPTSDGGYIICATSNSNDYYVSGNHSTAPNSADYWIVKIDSARNVQWQKCLGGTGYETVHDVIETADGKFIAVGQESTPVPNGDIYDPQGLSQGIWITGLDSAGSLLWNKLIGGKGNDDAAVTMKSQDGKIILAGSTTSIDHDASGNLNIQPQLSFQQSDMWLVKLDDHPNSITGNIFADVNANSLLDSNEFNLSAHKVIETNSGKLAFTDRSGNYRLDVTGQGNFTVKSDTLSYFNSVPLSHNMTFTGVDEIDSLNNFICVPGSSVNDLQVYITSILAFRPGFTTAFRIDYKNVGTTTLSGQIVFNFDNYFTYTNSDLTPSSINQDSVVWDFQNLAPFEERFITVQLTLSSAAVSGSYVQNIVFINPTNGDATPYNNVDMERRRVTGSHDPNDISVDIDTLYPGQLQNPPYLQYVIRFQNTGTDSAIFIRVANALSPLLDTRTFELLATSHPATVTYLNHSSNLEFFFDNIYLPDSNVDEPHSHGFIRYRMKPLNTLFVGDSVTNYAQIFFDYNNPVITNFASTYVTLQTGISHEKIANNDVTIYPNPFNNNCIVEVQNINSAECKLELYDSTGRIILQTTNSSGIFIIVNRLNSGIYFVKVFVGGNEIVKKLIAY